MTTHINKNKSNKKGRSKEWLENYKNKCDHNKKENKKTMAERLADAEMELRKDPKLKGKVTEKLIKELEILLKGK